MQRISRSDLAQYARTYLVGKPYVVGLMMNPDAFKKTRIGADALLPKELVP
jgi:hypothetical protein